MDYGEVLAKAWQIIWKHKVLWIFGILASCSGGGGGGGGNSSYQFSRGELPPRFERFFEFPNLNLPEWQIAMIVGAIVLVILLVIVLVIVLGTIGRIGLIKGTVQADQGVERLSFGQLFSESLPFFWRVFGLNLLIGLALLVTGLIFLAFFAGFTAVTFGIGAICLIPLICLLVPLLWLLQVVIEQGTIAIVVEDLGIMDGLRRGWEVFRANLGTMIVMALILYLGVSLIIGFVIALPLILVIAPVIAGVIGGSMFDSNQAVGGGLLIAALCFVAYLPVLIVLSGGLRAYIGSAWALTYLRLRPQGSGEVVESPSAA